MHADPQKYEPVGACPFCGYSVDPGACPECGKYVDPEAIVHHPDTARALAWERHALPLKPATCWWYLPVFARLLVRAQAIPDTPSLSRFPVVPVFCAMALAILASTLSDYRELAHPAWWFRQSTRDPAFALAVFSLCMSLLLLLFVINNPTRTRRYWRALLYGLVVYLAVRLVWVLWVSLRIVRFPAAISPLMQSTSSDPSVFQLIIYYVTVITSMVAPIALLLVLPCQAVFRRNSTSGGQACPHDDENKPRKAGAPHDQQKGDP